MATTHHNISGLLTKELLAVGDDVNVSQISLVNTHATIICTVDLYIEKTKSGAVNEGIFYLLKSVALPIGATLILEKGDLTFSNKANEFGLYIKITSNGGTVDVIIS
tara:strand:+ start:408 stop:728 length:321 start_codon:yes stop_codon:yes gene_type:complete